MSTNESGGALELCRGLPLLRVLPADELEQLPWQRVERAAGEPFFRQGDPADAAYGVITGRVRISKEAPGKRDLGLELLGPGEMFAVVALVRDVPLPATATAIEPTAAAKVLAKPFKELLARHPELSSKLLEIVSRRLLDAGSQRFGLAMESVEVRLARTLLSLGEKFGAHRGAELVFSQSLTRQTLADLAGTTVETAIRVMSKWTREGLVRSNASRITLLDPEALKRIAEDR